MQSADKRGKWEGFQPPIAGGTYPNWKPLVFRGGGSNKVFEEMGWKVQDWNFETLQAALKPTEKSSNSTTKQIGAP